MQCPAGRSKNPNAGLSDGKNYTQSGSFICWQKLEHKYKETKTRNLKRKALTIKLGKLENKTVNRDLENYQKHRGKNSTERVQNEKEQGKHRAQIHKGVTREVETYGEHSQEKIKYNENGSKQN